MGEAASTSAGMLLLAPAVPAELLGAAEETAGLPCSFLLATALAPAPAQLRQAV